MVTRELIKSEIDKIDEPYLDLLFNLIRVFESSLIEKNKTKLSGSINSVFNFYDSLAFDMGNFHFSRDDANER